MRRRELTIISEAPTVRPLGAGTGEGLTFHAPCAGDGLAGWMHGYMVTVNPADPGAGRHHEERVGHVNYDFTGGDSLVVTGAHGINGPDLQMAEGYPQVRAVIGGTGQFIGARGQVTTTRLASGQYEHRFDLLDEG